MKLLSFRKWVCNDFYQVPIVWDDASIWPPSLSQPEAALLLPNGAGNDFYDSLSREACTEAWTFAGSKWPASTHSNPRASYSKALFGPEKPFLVNRYLKTEKCIPKLRLLVWREPLFILRIYESNSSEVKRLTIFKRLTILLGLFGCENISGNGTLWYLLFFWRDKQCCYSPPSLLDPKHSMSKRSASEPGKRTCFFLSVWAREHTVHRS